MPSSFHHTRPVLSALVPKVDASTISLLLPSLHLPLPIPSAAPQAKELLRIHTEIAWYFIQAGMYHELECPFVTGNATLSAAERSDSAEGELPTLTTAAVEFFEGQGIPWRLGVQGGAHAVIATLRRQNGEGCQADGQLEGQLEGHAEAQVEGQLEEHTLVEVKSEGQACSQADSQAGSQEGKVQGKAEGQACSQAGSRQKGEVEGQACSQEGNVEGQAYGSWRLAVVGCAVVGCAVIGLRRNWLRRCARLS